MRKLAEVKGRLDRIRVTISKKGIYKVWARRLHEFGKNKTRAMEMYDRMERRMV